MDEDDDVDAADETDKLLGGVSMLEPEDDDDADDDFDDFDDELGDLDFDE